VHPGAARARPLDLGGPPRARLHGSSVLSWMEGPPASAGRGAPSLEGLPASAGRAMDGRAPCLCLRALSDGILGEEEARERAGGSDPERAREMERSGEETAVEDGKERRGRAGCEETAAAVGRRVAEPCTTGCGRLHYILM
jgi:hypothetical protein